MIYGVYPWRRRAAAPWAIPLVVGVLAFAARLIAVGGPAGLWANHGYDDGVYFAGAVALAHGRLPYQDFWFLHPPGVLIALSPFGVATHVVADSTALAAARLFVIGLGSATAVLLTRLARPWGRGPMLVAGLLYAVWPAAVMTERITLLEPFEVFAVVVAVLAVGRSRRPGAGRWWVWFAGAWLGFALTVKIWDVVPVAVVLVWCVIVCGWRPALRVAAAAAGTATLLVAPFAIAAPSAMWHMVIADQLGRGRAPVSLASRLAGIVGADRGRLAYTVQNPWVLGFLVVVLVVAGLVCWRTRRGRLWVALTLAQGIMVLASPSYFAHYAEVIAPTIVLMLAAAYAGAGELIARRGVPRTAAALRPATIAVVAAMVVPAFVVTQSVPAFPAAQVNARLPATGCIRADSPINVVLLNRLSSNLDAGCEEPIDVSGRAYQVGPRAGSGAPLPRSRNPQWQADIVQFLTSGAGAVLTRGTGNGFSPETQEEIDRRTVARIGNTRVLVNDPEPPAPGAPGAK